VDAFWTAQAISTEKDRRYGEPVSRQVGAIVRHHFDGPVDPKAEGQGMIYKQGEAAHAEVGDEFKYDQTRVVSWVNPERVRPMTDGLTGLEVNEAIRDGGSPSQPSRGCWASAALPCRKGR
jgi:hypothetical protein